MKNLLDVWHDAFCIINKDNPGYGLFSCYQVSFYFRLSSMKLEIVNANEAIYGFHFTFQFVFWDSMTGGQVFVIEIGCIFRDLLNDNSLDGLSNATVISIDRDLL